MKRSIRITILSIILASQFGFAFVVYAAPVQKYIVQVNSSVLDLNVVNPSNLQEVFVDSTNMEFKNTFSFESEYNLLELKEKLGLNISYIQENHNFKTDGVVVNDPGFSNDGYNTDREWGLIKGRFPEAWEKTQGSNSVVVGVIDTGIDALHEDLSIGQIASGYDFLTKTIIPFGMNSDENGHGTLVSGVIAATPNNFRGIAGASFTVTLMPLKALDATGSGNSSDVAAAIVWAADHGANIINMSLGGVGFANDVVLSNAITYAFKKNIVIVAAVGNDVAVTGGDLDVAPVFPVCNDNGENMVIGVAATDVYDSKTVFSNYGKSCVDVTAPGKRILSTINYDPNTKQPTPSAYAYASGTSLAAPFVSAEAALLKAFNSNLSNKEIRDRIIQSATPIDNLNQTQCSGKACNGLIGFGRIDVMNALDQVINKVTSIKEGDLVSVSETGLIYYISGGQRQRVSESILHQRFSGQTPKQISEYEISGLASGPWALPLTGSLVKTANDPTIYYISEGLKRPVTASVFNQIKPDISSILFVTTEELNSWVSGKFLAPVEGTLVKGNRTQTVYWVVDGSLHPINYAFWKERGLDIFPILYVPESDLPNYPIGSVYIR
ncbi:MAG: S8 family serine peptidase [Patescibacteria group bacterium]